MEESIKKQIYVFRYRDIFIAKIFQLAGAVENADLHLCWGKTHQLSVLDIKLKPWMVRLQS